MKQNPSTEKPRDIADTVSLIRALEPNVAHKEMTDRSINEYEIRYAIKRSGAIIYRILCPIKPGILNITNVIEHVAIPPVRIENLNLSFLRE